MKKKGIKKKQSKKVLYSSHNVTVVLCFVLVALALSTLVTVVRLAGFSISLSTITTPSPTAHSQSVVSTPKPVEDKSNKFNIEQAKVGDFVGTLEIKSIAGYKNAPVDANNAFVEFDGVLTLTGDVMYSPKESYGGESVCMRNFDEQSQKKLPKLSSQYYVELNFCFNNLDLAKKLLVKNPAAENQGIRTATINNYKIQWFPVSIHNMVDLISAK